MTENYFYKVIHNLRQYEEVMLYANVLTFNKEEEEKVMAFLAQEYEVESLNYAINAPSFNAEAALWAAKTVYLAAQLILYRQNKEHDLANMFPNYHLEIDSSAIVSVDLCLRFLPDMLLQLNIIDNEDVLIEILETILVNWPYSSIKHTMTNKALNFDKILTNKCTEILLINRIIENKRIDLALLPQIKPLVSGSLGFFASKFWNEFNIEKTINE